MAENILIFPGLEKMAGVQQQRRRFEKWRVKFSHTVARQLNNLFIHLVCPRFHLDCNPNGIC